MSKHRGVMSEELKTELAKEIGVYDIVRKEGWGAVPSRDCGNLVAAAIQYAEKMLQNQNGGK